MPDRVIRQSSRSPDNGPRVEDDRWRTLGVDPAADLANLPPGPIIVSLALWQARKAELLARGEPLGVWLKPDDEPEAIADDFASFQVVAVHFPKFGDGRGFSTAALLRTRYGYRGELRAFGDIGRDHLFFLARVGFDSFRLPEERDPHDALLGLKDFSLRYQGSVDDPLPLFRKRSAAGALR
jgi:uncharacterized protein (DUF934 family)